MKSQRIVSAHLLLALSLVGCSGESNFALQRSWGDQQAIIFVEDETGELIDGPRLDDGGTLQLQLPKLSAFRITVELFASEAEGGPPLSRCGITTEGNQSELPEPTMRLSSPLLDGQTPRPIELSDVDISRLIPLRFQRCSTLCDLAIVSAQLPEPPVFDPPRPEFENDLELVAAVSDEVAFVGGGDPVEIFGRAEQNQIEWTDIPDTGSVITSLTYDQQNTIFGTAASILFSYDRSGRHVFTRNYGVPVLIESGLDGPLVLVENGVPHTVVRQDFELIPMMGAPQNPTSMAIIRRSRMAMISDNKIYVLEDGAWQLEYSGAGIDQRTRIFGNDELLAVAGPNGILLRDEREKRWTALSSPAPFERLEIVTGEALTGRRLIVMGEFGGAAIWEERRRDEDDGGWCALQIDLNNTLVDGSLSPSGRTFYIVGDDSRTSLLSAFVSVELP